MLDYRCDRHLNPLFGSLRLKRTSGPNLRYSQYEEVRRSELTCRAGADAYWYSGVGLSAA